jgi:S1-C subfamily serine protease
MQNHQDIIEDLNKCTVAIQESGGSAKVPGTGVIITNDGVLLTCFHVVGDIKSKTIKHNSIDVYFPEFKITKPAQVVKEYSDPFLDVALFKMEDGLLPEKTVVSNLGESIVFGHRYAS